ncbi:FAD:protein FMN transferase [Aeoliella mucimassa]|uniref:FAD:protein FMN transferase n=1 Tax=Aeoliella mucimassa TaxID=2527972 RepID=A0A518AMZ0_9BACT|nr:FAD:protein FMN transferase [Aeoliella mucimassa]QDU56088.1 Thiamine biosynthesis lipoprotein ApbE precursor [Aeoliella mucimassa]
MPRLTHSPRNLPTFSHPSFALVLVWGVLLSSAVAHSEEVRLIGRTMGTSYHATVGFDSSLHSEEEVQQVIDDRLAEINALMSTYDPKSELSEFNQSESTDWFDLSPETAKVTAAAIDIAKRSEGSYDPTVGPLVNLWGFGPDGQRKVPPQEEIDAARARVGYEKLEVRLDPPAVRKSLPTVYVDLSSIAKGYASDAVCEVLHDPDKGVGCSYAMVEIGGEIRTLNIRDNKQPWRLGIELPGPDTQISNRIVLIDNGDALATSGDYRNFFESGGTRYSHTIDIKSGTPVTNHLVSVSVRAATCMEADALATAIMTMGFDKGSAWATEQKVAAVLLEHTDAGYREQSTPAWKATEEQESNKANSEEQANSTMLTYFLITLGVFGIAVIAMAVGVIFSNRCVKGTCGGLANMQDGNGKTACELCSNPSPTCSGKPEQEESRVES